MGLTAAHALRRQRWVDVVVLELGEDEARELLALLGGEEKDGPLQGAYDALAAIPGLNPA